MKHYLSYLLGLALFAVTISCSVKNSAIKETDKSEKSLSDGEVSQEFALEAYLNRTPGVFVNGSGQNATVQVRGVNSVSGNTQPLFIVNGTDIGSSYSNAANLLRGMEIKSVRVLKGADTSLYGVRGSGGVIIIKAQ